MRGGRNNAGAVPCQPELKAGHWLLAGALLEVCCKVSKVRSHVGKEAKEGRANNSEHVGGGNCQCRDNKERCDQNECKGYDVQCLSGGVLQCLAFRLGEVFSPSLCFNSTADPAGRQVLRQDSTKNFWMTFQTKRPGFPSIAGDKKSPASIMRRAGLVLVVTAGLTWCVLPEAQRLR